MERFTRPTEQSAPASQGVASAPASHTATKSGVFQAPTLASKVLVVSIIVVALSVITVLGLSAFGFTKGDSLVKKDKYQAVFLDNGQVYFGKLSDVNRDYVQLTDIFYLQVDQQVQPNQTEAGEEASTAQPQVSLAKLGNELHGPEDSMFIQRSKITFWENLKDDGQVTTAIKDYKENGDNQDQAQ